METAKNTFVSKLKNLYFSQKNMAIIFAVLTTIVYLSNFWIGFQVMAFIAVVVSLAICEFEQQLMIVAYMVVFSGFQPLYIVVIGFVLLSLIVRYIFDVRQKKRPFYHTIFILTTMIAIIFTAISGKADTEGFYNFALFVCLLYAVYFFFVYSDEINVHKTFYSLIAGLIVSAVIGLITIKLGWIDGLCYDDEVVRRYSFFTENVNQLSILSLLAVGYLLCNILKKYFKNGDLNFVKLKNFWLDLLLLCVVILIGMFAKSKTYILVLGLLFVYTCVVIILRLKLKSLAVLASLCVLAGVMLFIFNDYAMSMIERFFAYDNYKSFWSKITTGRTDLWAEYFDYIFSSPVTFLFGDGLLTKDILFLGPHSTWIYFAYRVGFVGMALLVTLGYLYLKNKKSKFVFTLENILVLAVWFVVSFEEMIFSDRFFLFLVLGVLMVSKRSNEENKDLQMSGTDGSDAKFQAEETTSSNKNSHERQSEILKKNTDNKQIKKNKIIKTETKNNDNLQ